MKPCVCKPAKRKPRQFKLSDLERIITKMLDQQFTPGQILGVALVATDGLIHFEFIYRQIRVIRAVTGVLLAVTFLRKIAQIGASLKKIYEEIADRLGEFPQLRNTISIVDEASGILGAIFTLLGGLVGAAKLLISLDEEWVDEVRNNGYGYIGVEPPEYAFSIDSID